LLSFPCCSCSQIFFLSREDLLLIVSRKRHGQESDTFDEPARKMVRTDVPPGKAARPDQPVGKAARPDQPVGKAARPDQPVGKATRPDQWEGKAARPDQPVGKAARPDQWEDSVSQQGRSSSQEEDKKRIIQLEAGLAALERRMIEMCERSSITQYPQS
jgi:hypothetical protein